MKHKTYKKLYMLCYDLHIQSFVDRIPDEIYLKLVYFLQCGYWFNIKNPQNYNEKLQWLKVYDRNSMYSKLVDKYEVKKIVKTKLGEKYIIPTLAIGESFIDINIAELPNKFVIKCTHDSGSTVICRDKNKMNWRKIQKKFDSLVKRNYFGYLREWQYKNIKPRIIVEKYIGKSNELPYDYKFFCFNGVPKVVMVAKDRETITKSNFYDMNFIRLPLKIENPNFDEPMNKPENFEEMIQVASILSKGIRHVRVDLYNICGHIYFSEMTFQHWGGFSHIEPPEWNKIMGDWINLEDNYGI